MSGGDGKVGRVDRESDWRRRNVAASRVGAWILVVCWALIILTLVLQPGGEELGRRRLRLDVTSLGHAAYFAVLAVLVGNALLRSGVRRTGWWSIVAVALFGIACEFIQVGVPGRTPSMPDLAGDLVGACAGALALGMLAARYEQFRPGPRITRRPPPHRPEGPLGSGLLPTRDRP